MATYTLPLRFAAACVLALALASCGGGISFTLDLGDDPPAVALAASVSEANRGDKVQLVAAASDDYGVSDVEFYRVDAQGRRTLLGTDGQAPFAWEVTIPPLPQGAQVQYLARAYDRSGQHSDSEPVVITVR